MAYFYGLVDDLINNPNWYKDFDDIIQEPGKFWDILKQGTFPQTSPFGKWGQGKYFKDLKEDAGKFEALINTKLIETYGNANKIVDEVTMDIVKKNGNDTEMFRNRIDFIAKDNNKFNLFEAKFTRKEKNWTAEWLDATTDNQSITFNWFKNNEVTEVIIRATDAKKIDALAEIGIIIKDGKAKIDINDISLTLYGSKANKIEISSFVIIK